VKRRPDELKEFVQLYVPFAQDLSDDVYLVVRPKSGRAEALTTAVRAAISRVDKEQLVSVREIRTLEDIERTVNGRHRFRAVLVVAFAGLALVLAMIGVFGILAYSVQQHVRDFGVRRALGATTNYILGLGTMYAASVIATGAAFGLVLSAVFARFIEKMLFGVRPLDPATFALVAIVVGITAVLAIAGPAWRAVRIDPATALRNT
jgi:putative ABC transport system permease protein